MLDVQPDWSGPRVLCVSQGTTGTHALFFALAYMGLPAVHWSMESVELAAGDDGAPVYAGWGSMAIMTDALALKLANACRRASRRLVLLISWSKLITLGEGPHELSADGRALTPRAVLVVPP